MAALRIRGDIQRLDLPVPLKKKEEDAIKQYEPM